jgi:hypothetical protein
VTIINHSYMFWYFLTRLLYKIENIINIELPEQQNKTRAAQYNNIIIKIKTISSVGTLVDDKNHIIIIILLVRVKESAFSAWKTAWRIPWAANSVIFLTTNANKTCYYLTATQCSRFSTSSISTNWTANSLGIIYAVWHTMLSRFPCVPLPLQYSGPYYHPVKIN